MLSGNFGAAALATPSQLLTIDVGSDSRRIAATHHEWSSRFLTTSSDPPGPEPCLEMVSPYDFAASTAYAASHPSYDACIARGFSYSASVQSWRGDPGAAPPLANNVEARTEVQTVDNLGRVLRVKHFGDLHRDDDDVCVDTTYAAPTGSSERVLFATSSQAVTDCATTTYARQSWEYDQLAAGSVSAGLVTAHIVERHDDTGALLGSIRRFDATFDTAGNPSTVSTTREDGATRTVTATYDPFGLAVTSLAVSSPTLTTLTTSIVRDPVTLAAQTGTATVHEHPRRVQRDLPDLLHAHLPGPHRGRQRPGRGVAARRLAAIRRPEGQQRHGDRPGPHPVGLARRHASRARDVQL